MTERKFDRLPNPPDARDWKMSDHLQTAKPLAAPASTSSPSLAAVDQALASMQKRHVAKSVLAFCKAICAFLHEVFDPTPEPPTPTPVPPGPTPPEPPNPKPPVPPTAVYWADQWQLDQGDTGHCVGFGWAQRFNSGESNDPDADTWKGYTNDDAHAIYYECKVIDGEPGSEDGSYVRSGAIAMKNRGEIAAYAFADNVDDVVAWVMTKGPVVVGTDWLSDMDDPDRNGVVRATGYLRGGHCYLLDGYDTKTQMFRFQNSWGNWAANGYFYMSKSDFANLLADQGDACGAWEV